MKRVVTGVALILGAIYLIFLSAPWGFLLAAAGFSTACYWEYSDLVAGHGVPRPGIFGLLAGFIILLWPQQSVLGCSLVAVAALAAALRFVDLKLVLAQVSCAFFGALYTFAPWRFAADLRNRSVHWLFFALALNWAGDSAAYYIGRRFGKRKLAPHVSPGKSREGAIGSIAGSVLFGVAYMRYFVPAAPWWIVAIIAITGNIAGQFGDLAESAMKRGAGAKDSGRLLPGHGGVLDRVDSSLFALPVVFALYEVFGRLIP